MAVEVRVPSGTMVSKVAMPLVSVLVMIWRLKNPTQMEESAYLRKLNAKRENRTEKDDSLEGVDGRPKSEWAARRIAAPLSETEMEVRQALPRRRTSN